MFEVNPVVGLTAAVCQHDGVALPLSPRSARALLVVEPLGRHVRLVHCLQRTNVYADLHRRRNGKDVDFIYVRYDEALPDIGKLLAGEEDRTEMPLPLRLVIGLASKFFSV
jgi:hypothetical protein